MTDAPDDARPGMNSGRGLLAGESLLGALDAGRIFKDGSWDAASIKGAGYEIRLADDWLAKPGRPGSGEVAVARPDTDSRIDMIELAPGDTAVVASVERFILDFNITASIGQKFRWAAQGLQVLHGSTAHPGYGWHLTSTGWEPKPDERLYLVIANIGPDAITIHKATPIAYLQFFEVERVVPREDIPNIGFDRLTNRFMRDDNNPAGLFYYRAVRDVRASIADLKGAVEKDVASLKSSDEKAHLRLSALEAGVYNTSKAMELVVVFGVFLIAVTLLGVVYNALTEAVSKIPANAAPDQLNLLRMLSVGFGLAAMVPVGLVLLIVLRRPFPVGKDQ